jgi:uncharacterized membrane protein
VTFFDRHGFFREPELLDAPRPPDVSPAMRWYPVVTMMQMGVVSRNPRNFRHRRITRSQG